jgi:hypothetical protein
MKPAGSATSSMTAFRIIARKDGDRVTSVMITSWQQT